MTTYHHTDDELRAFIANQHPLHGDLADLAQECLEHRANARKHTNVRVHIHGDVAPDVAEALASMIEASANHLAEIRKLSGDE
jgi:uncharacterized protein YbgA (DUF1722 family)